MSDEKTVQATHDGPHGAAGVSTPNPEVVPKAERRRFTAEYKLRILAEADGCKKPGEIGALLRGEGNAARRWLAGGVVLQYNCLNRHQIRVIFSFAE